MTGSSPEFEVPVEHLPGQQDFNIRTDPEFLPVDSLVVSTDVLPLNSVRTELETCMQSLIQKNGLRVSSEVQKQVINRIINLLPKITCSTEEQYIWMLCYICRLFLQNFNINIHVHHFSLINILRTVQVPGLYCPIKMHLITKELLSVMQNNANNVAYIVRKIHHINPVTHYVCISAVSAIIFRFHHRTYPEVFQLLSPNDLDAIIQAYELKENETNLQDLYTFLNSLSLYHNLVLMNSNLNQMHSEEIVEFLKLPEKYLKRLKAWLTKAVKFIERLQRKATAQNEAILHVKELIQFELLANMEHSKNGKNSTRFDYNQFVM